MSVSFKVENVEISAVRDRAMFNTFAGNRSYVVKDIGDELAVTSSSSSFVVSLGTGEAVICGGSMLSEGEASTITLGANENGYIVIEIDLLQTGANICRFKKVPSLVQGNINGGNDYVYDFPLYRYTTNSAGVSSITDLRVIVDNASGVLSINGVAPSSNGNVAITGGRGIKITNNDITNTFEALSGVNLNDIRYNFQGAIITSNQNVPSGVSSIGYLVVLQRSSNNNYAMQIYAPYNNKYMYFRKLNNGIWTEWEKIANVNDTYCLSIPEKNINENDDLNTYTAIGQYRSANASISASLSNCPFTASGFKLTVEYSSSTSHIFQYLLGRSSNNNEWFMRASSNGGSTWTRWVALDYEKSNLVGSLNLNSVIFIGDSFTRGDGLTNPDTENWAVRLANQLNIPKYNRYGGSGVGFQHVSGVIGKNFLNFWKDNLSTMNKDATTIFIMGGLNDKGQNTTNVENAITTFITEIRKTFPKTQTKIVYLFNPTPQMCSRDLINACYKSMIANDVIVLPQAIYFCLFGTSLYQNDYIHPNASGHTFIAQSVANLIKGGQPLTRHTLNFGTGNNSVIFENKGDGNVVITITGTHDGSTRDLVIGQFPTWIYALWSVASRYGPDGKYRHMFPFDTNTEYNLGFIRYGGGTGNIYACAMKKINDTSSYASGNFTIKIVEDALDLLG